MEMCDRKYMFGDKSTFGTIQNGQDVPPKKLKKKYFFVH